MGDVVTGKYQFSLNSWLMTPGRYPVVTMVPTIMDRFLCLLIPNPPEFDPTLLLRPLTNIVWLCIVTLLIVACCFLTVPHIFIKGYENTTTNQIVMVSIWCSFVLINAYYGGALTMFFVAELKIPFNSLRDVLKIFPEWNFVLPADNIILIKEPALNVSQKFKDLIY